MSRVDEFDMSVLRLEDGVRWATEAVQEDRNAPGDDLSTTYYPHLVRAIVNGPEMLRTYESLTLLDMFLDIMSRAPESSMRRYEALRALARRFGPGANEWVGRRRPSSVEFTRRDEDDAGSNIEAATGYMLLSRRNEIDLYNMDAYLAAFLCHHMMDLAAMAPGGEAVSNSAHFDFANNTVITGMPPQSQKFFEPSPDYVPVLMEDAFGHIIPDTVYVSLTHEPGSAFVEALVSRDLSGYSMFRYFEPYARRVIVQPKGVRFSFRAEPRSRKNPLFYEYSDGAGRRGVESNGGELLRIEARASSRMDSSAIFGTIAGISRVHEGGASIYIEGSRGTSSSGSDIVGDPFGFEEGVVDLVAWGPDARAVLVSAFTALSAVAAGTV